MKAPVTFASLVVLGAVTSFAAAGAQRSTPLAAHQEPRGIGNLVVPGDRVDIAYGLDSPPSRSVTGFLYVRNDVRRGFVRLSLKPVPRPAAGLHVRVPSRLIRGRRLLYYAVIRDTRSRRSVTLPGAGARAPQSAWILQKPAVVRLGTHRFGETRGPGTVVARARPDQVGWQIPPPGQGPHFGPQSFAVGSDRSIWLHDSLNDRMLVWNPDAPETIVRSVPLPERTADNDVALGPAGTLYVTRVLGRGTSSYLALFRLGATGAVMWQNRLAGSYSPDARTFGLGINTSLRFGPDGTLHGLAFMSLPGGEWCWMPVATPGGSPLSRAAQRRGTHWPYQPVAGGLRLVSEVYTPPNVETAPHEARFALIDRRGQVTRAWRILSRTDINLNMTTPELVGGDPVIVVDATRQSQSGFQWEYVVLRLGRSGARERFSLPRAVYGDNLLADLRIGPDGALYQLASSPTIGVVISRYSLNSSRPS